MDKSDIKTAIKNMNVWLEECHNDGDTVVMTANVLRSIRDNYCELLRCRDAIKRLADRNRKCIYLSDEETTQYCVDAICTKFKTEEQIKSEAYREFADKLTDIISNHIEQSLDNPDGNNYFLTDVYTDIDNLKKELTRNLHGTCTETTDQTATSVSLIDGHIEE